MVVVSTATGDVGTKLERKKLVLPTAEIDSSTCVVLSALGDENSLEGSNRLSVVSTDAPVVPSAGEGEGMTPTDDCGVVVLLGAVDDSINVVGSEATFTADVGTLSVELEVGKGSIGRTEDVCAMLAVVVVLVEASELQVQLLTRLRQKSGQMTNSRMAKCWVLEVEKPCIMSLTWLAMK